MILVHIEYDRQFIQERLCSTEADADIALKQLGRFLEELRDATESIVGLVFAEEQERVDIRVRSFYKYDQFEEPLFITIDVEEGEITGQTTKSLCDQFLVHFGTHIDAYVPGHVPVRVWVRRITGSFAETARYRD